MSKQAAHLWKILPPEERSRALEKLKASSVISGSWEDQLPDRNAIQKTFCFKNFKQAWVFMNKSATLAETMNHHPEWSNMYGKVHVTLITHKGNGVSQKDITMAETMDSYAASLLETNKTKLEFVPTCDLYDQYLDQAKVPTVPFRNLGGNKKFCGNAVTVKCFEDNSRVKELVATPGEGRVMIVDGGASVRCALLGDMLAAKAVENGWSGLVIFGAVRDAEELAKLPLGVQALGTTPRKSNRKGEGHVDLPVQIGNVWCYPGDKVYADEDGVLLVPAASEMT